MTIQNSGLQHLILAGAKGGKTTTLCELAGRQLAARQSVVYFTFEYPPLLLHKRIYAAGRAGSDAKLRVVPCTPGLLSPRELDATLGDLITWANFHADVVCIDDLQLALPRVEGAPAHQHVLTFLETYQAIAHHYNHVQYLAVATNKVVAKTPRKTDPKEPKMADLVEQE